MTATDTSNLLCGLSDIRDYLAKQTGRFFGKQTISRWIKTKKLRAMYKPGDRRFWCCTKESANNLIGKHLTKKPKPVTFMEARNSIFADVQKETI